MLAQYFDKIRMYDLKWQNTDKEKTALARALGVQPPDEDFWLPVSKLTALIPPKQKVLSYADNFIAVTHVILSDIPIAGLVTIHCKIRR